MCFLLIPFENFVCVVFCFVFDGIFNFLKNISKYLG